MGNGFKDSLNDFLTKAYAKHGDKYDYSLVVYINSKTPVIIICKTHGQFTQAPVKHLWGHNCPHCAKISQGLKRRLNTDDFIKKSKLIHGSKYDYSSSQYINAVTKVSITCPTHGVFRQLPYSHMNGSGCPLCAHDRQGTLRTLGTLVFCERASVIHNNKYDYSLVNYISAKNPVEIICKKHGVFKQSPDKHLRGGGCPKCSPTYVDTNMFIERSKIIHGDRYDYSVSVYNGWDNYLTIICSEHGEFIQKAGSHLNGFGCHKCSGSSIERKIVLFLDTHAIEYIKEKTFPSCVNKDGYRYRFDFYIPSVNLLIEYQGRQHFKSVSWFGGDIGLEKQKYNDEYKKQWAQSNGYNLIEFTYKRRISYIEKTLKSILFIK